MSHLAPTRRVSETARPILSGSFVRRNPVRAAYMVSMTVGTAHVAAMDTPALPAGYEHGTIRAYRHCRPACAQCKAANAEAAAERRATKLAAGMPEDAHGKPSGYTFWNCRCRRCKKAYTESRKGRAPKLRVKPDLAQMPDEDHGSRRGHRYWNCPCAPCRAVGTALRAEARIKRRAVPDALVEIRRYNYRMYPEPAAKASLRRVFGSCRFVYNSYIALARERYQNGEKHPSAYDAAKTLVTEARRAPETVWLAEVAHSALSAAVHDAAAAYQRFFDSAAGRIKGRPVGRPKFKSRRSARHSARYPEGSFAIRGGWQNTGSGGGRLHLANIDQDIRVNWHRALPGYASAATVREEPDGTFWVSFIVRVPVPAPKTPTRSPRVAGVDVGLSDYAAIVYTDGNREKIANPRHYREAEDALRRADRNLSRKSPGSNNYAKAKRAHARAHRRVANLRENHARQLASKLSRENQTVVVETLEIAGMARTKYGKSIQDAGWRQFLGFLEEACARKGVDFIEAPRYFPSTQICSQCGVNGGKKPLHVRDWVCTACGTHLDRDYNAAVNIITAGPAVSACGRDRRLQLAGAGPDEAGSHRNDARVSARRRRKRVRRPMVAGGVQASSATAETQGFPPHRGKSDPQTWKTFGNPLRDPLSRMGSGKS